MPMFIKDKNPAVRFQNKKLKYKQMIMIQVQQLIRLHALQLFCLKLHLLFGFSYFFVGFVISDVMTFILVTILGALDFWVVKNVTGRLLVGLRWWSDFDSNGKQIWKFESYDGEFTPNKVDTAFFWTSQIAGVLVWGAFFVLKMLSLSFFWALLVFINLSLCATNLYGYYKCRGEYSKKLKNLRNQGLVHVAGRLF